MGAGEVLLVIVMLVVLGAGLYILWLNLPTEPVELARINGNKVNGKVEQVYSNGTQFYPNMRFRDNRISYHIEEVCDSKKVLQINRALGILEDKTILELVESRDGELNILCSQLPPEPEKEGYFIAGEGGPTEIINTSVYSVIFAGKMSLFRDEKCEEPQIAMHEILHVLGFDHNINPGSIMYPTTDCAQRLDDYIIDEINKLYAVESRPDLAIMEVSAVKSGPYLNFNINVTNIGLSDAKSVLLEIFADEEKVKTFDLNEIEIGVRKALSVENLRIKRSAEKIGFAVLSGQSDINDKNNKAELIVISD